ncbi:MAG: segregation/condensation protein A [Armatimonadetes bacterium]|nr:segregation/condensation protein A [Armatimonadota bacterium]
MLENKYQVKLEAFEGPLDLLLHLVEKSQLDICEISLAKICDEYWEYLKLMQKLNLEIESSFLVILASLLVIKSRALLPLYEQEEIQSEETESELVEKLKEYKKYKVLAEHLQILEKEARKIFARIVEKDLYLEVNSFDIVNSLKNLLEKKLSQNQKINKINLRKEISIPQKMEEIYNLVLFKKKVNFLEVLPEDAENLEIIASFLAILELAYLNKISLSQKNKCEIYISLPDIKKYRTEIAELDQEELAS